MRGAVAGGSQGRVVGKWRRGDVKERDGGEEEEQQERRRRQDGAAGVRARAVVVAPAPPRQDHVGVRRLQILGQGNSAAATAAGELSRGQRRHGCKSIWWGC
jgi:hypothetical protein